MSSQLRNRAGRFASSSPRKPEPKTDPLRLARDAVIAILTSPDATASEKIAAANFVEKIASRERTVAPNRSGIDVERLTTDERTRLEALVVQFGAWREEVWARDPSMRPNWAPAAPKAAWVPVIEPAAADDVPEDPFDESATIR